MLSGTTCCPLVARVALFVRAPQLVQIISGLLGVFTSHPSHPSSSQRYVRSTMHSGALRVLGWGQRSPAHSRSSSKSFRIRLRRPILLLMMITASATITWFLLASPNASMHGPEVLAESAFQMDNSGTEQAVETVETPILQKNLTRHFRGDHLHSTTISCLTVVIR